MPEPLPRRWIEPEPVSVPDEYTTGLGLHPLAAQILYRKGLRELASARAFLNPNAYTPAPAEDLPGILAAAKRIERAIHAHEPVCVWGDFDVDGQTSTALLVSTLRTLGAEVSYHIPVRAHESHGVNIKYLQPILEKGIKLLITCDTGSQAHEAVKMAASRGVDTIITDHHELPVSLPEAYVLVSPRLLAENHPLSGLPGVGVAYLLGDVLLRRAGMAERTAAFLDLAALGIVADLAPQTGDTRYLLQRGLAALRDPRRVGIQVMLETAGLNPAWLTEEHIAFVLAPRLNALGRLEDANPAVELLTTEDQGRARVLVTHLEGLNAQRRHLSEQVLKGALSLVEKDSSLLSSAALVLSHPEWPAGVIGIVASQLVERYHRPVVLISSPSGQAARGSARSIEGVNISQAISSASSLLLTYGGHSMAAGLSIDLEKINSFRRALSQSVEHQLGGEAPQPVILISGEVRLEELSLDFVNGIEQLAPFGSGNPSPVFLLRNLSLQSSAAIGRDREHVQVIVTDESGHTQKVLWWRGSAWPLPEGRFDLACSVRSSNYLGERGVQVEWVDSRPISENSLEIRTTYEVLDYRSVAHPLPILTGLQAQGNTVTWAEGITNNLPGGTDRTRLKPAEALILWTTPPGPVEFRNALQTVLPRKVILFAVDPLLASSEALLNRLAGLVKYALEKLGGQINLAKLAGAVAARESSVLLGLKWMEQRGLIHLEWLEGGSVQVTEGDHVQKDGAAQVLDQLERVLEESAAFREYFQTGSEKSLF